MPPRKPKPPKRSKEDKRWDIFGWLILGWLFQWALHFVNQIF